jgi:two-component system LytT family response regulator
MNRYKAYIVDDESDNVDLLKYLLKKYCLNIEIIGESNTFQDCINDLNTLNPEILFLDIKLNDKNAFDILDVINSSESEIIFVTAYQEFALKAFKYNAIDYVLKPISIEDLVVSVNKAILRIEEKKIFENQILNNFPSSKSNSSSILTISSLDKIEIIKKSDILFCKSDGRYTTFYLTDKTEILACKNIGEFEILLNDDIFFRIHNSYIINVSHVKNINKKVGYYCEMINGAFLPIAKRRYQSFSDFLNLLKN